MNIILGIIPYMGSQRDIPALLQNTSLQQLRCQLLPPVVLWQLHPLNQGGASAPKWDLPLHQKDHEMQMLAETADE